MLAAPVASAQSSVAGEREQLVARLTLNSAAVLRAFQHRAAAEQQRAFEALSQKDAELTKALAEKALAQEARSTLEQELEIVTTDREALVQRLSQQDLEFAAETRALAEQFTGIVAQASPEKLTALTRFADGDRVGAFALLREIVAVENAARERAANAASARNLKDLLALASEMVLRGEESPEAMLGILEEILVLTPDDLEAILVYIASLKGSYRFDKALAAADSALAVTTDPWARMEIEGEALRARLRRQPVLEASDPFMQAVGAVQITDATAQRACSAAAGLASVELLFAMSEPLRRLAANCVDVYGASLHFSPEFFSYLRYLVGYHIKEGRYAEAERLLGLWDQNRLRFPDIEKFQLLSGTYTASEQFSRAQIAEGRGNTRPALHHYRNVLEQLEVLLPLFPEGDETEELRLTFAGVQAILQTYEGMPEQAAKAVDEAIGPPRAVTPEDVRNRPNFWAVRLVLLDRLAHLWMDAGDRAKAEEALDRARALAPLLSPEFPVKSELVYEHTSIAGCGVIGLAVTMTEMRLASGNAIDADQLKDFAGWERGSQSAPVFRNCYELPRLRGVLALAGAAESQGRRDEAKALLEGGLAAAGRYAEQEPDTFAWKQAKLAFRFRLAQVANNQSDRDAVIEEAKSLVSGLDRIGEETWISAMEKWSPGHPIDWSSDFRASGGVIN